MIVKERRIVTTFYTTAEAFAAERCCRMAGLEGRLIPAPRSLSAGCGIAWSTTPEKQDALTQLLAEKGIEYEGIYKT